MIGLLYAVLGIIVVLLPQERARSLGGSGLALFALGRAAAAMGSGAAPASFLLVNNLLTAAGIGLVAGALLMAILRRGEPETAEPPRPAMPGHPALDPILLAGLALAAALPGLLLVGVGMLFGVAAAGRGVVRSGRPLWFVPLAAGAGLLGTALAFTLTILGPMGDQVGGLPGGPFSPAAERLLVLLFGGGSLLLAGLPPLTRAPWRLALAPYSAILLVRVVGTGFPLGQSEWQSLAMLVLGAGFIAAAVRRNWAVMAACGGLTVLWSGRPEAALPGSILVLSGWLIDQGECVRQSRGISLAPRWRGVPAVVPVIAAGPALEATLRAQVLLPVAAVVSAAAVLVVHAWRRIR